MTGPNREFSFLQRLDTLRKTSVSLDGSDLKTTFRDLGCSRMG